MSRARVVVLAAVITAIGIIVWKLAPVIVLVFGGCLFAVLLRGIAETLSNHTFVSPKWAVLVVLLLALVLIGLGSWLLGAKIMEQTDQLTEQIPQSVKRIETYLQEQSWGRTLIRALHNVDPRQLGEKALQWSNRVATGLVGFIGGIIFVVFAGIYGAFQPEIYEGAIVRLVPIPYRERARQILERLGHILRWWLIGRFSSMAVVGALTWIGLLIVGTPLALALAIIAALLSFVPILGPIISAIPAVLVAMVQSPLDVVWVIVVYSVVQFLEGNFITPLIEQRAVSIPPLIVLSAQLAAGALVGSIGIIFATPMAAAVAVVAEEIYIRDILGDRGQSFSD